MRGEADGGGTQTPSRITEGTAPPRRAWNRQGVVAAIIFLALVVYSIVTDRMAFIRTLMAVAVLGALILVIVFVVGRWERHPANAY